MTSKEQLATNEDISVQSIFKTNNSPIIEPNRKQRRAQKAANRSLQKVVNRIKKSAKYKKNTNARNP